MKRRLGWPWPLTTHMKPFDNNSIINAFTSGMDIFLWIQISHWIHVVDITMQKPFRFVLLDLSNFMVNFPLIIYRRIVPRLKYNIWIRIFFLIFSYAPNWRFVCLSHLCHRKQKIFSHPRNHADRSPSK